MLDTVL